MSSTSLKYCIQIYGTAVYYRCSSSTAAVQLCTAAVWCEYSCTRFRSPTVQQCPARPPAVSLCWSGRPHRRRRQRRLVRQQSARRTDGAFAMCFDQPTSYGFAAAGLAIALYANRTLKASGGVAARGADRFSAGLLYFVLMETLQGASWLRE